MGNEFKSNDDDGLGLEQDDILENELIKSKLELKDSTDTEKEKEVNTDDYEYTLKQDDGCQAYDPMTTSMIQTMDPMTSSMINFDTQTIHHDGHGDGETESLQMHENNLMQNGEHKDEKNYSSSSEDEEDHTEKKDKEKDHSSSSSSEDENEDVEKGHAGGKVAKDRHSSSSSSSEEEDNEHNDNDMQALIENKKPSELLTNDSNDDYEVSAELTKDSFEKRADSNSDSQSSSSDEADEVDDDEHEKDITDENNLLQNQFDAPFGGQRSEYEEEKDICNEKDKVQVPLALDDKIEPSEDSDVGYMAKTLEEIRMSKCEMELNECSAHSVTTDSIFD